MTDELTILGSTVRHAVDHVETFAKPSPALDVVTFVTDELVSTCPVTGQPDLSRLTIEYAPNRRCVESKSLKLYLWRFRDRAVFAEAIAVEIADEVTRSARPHRVTVTVEQRVRGGIALTARASREWRDDPGATDD